jgi:hypothetical protein
MRRALRIAARVALSAAALAGGAALLHAAGPRPAPPPEPPPAPLDASLLDCPADALLYRATLAQARMAICQRAGPPAERVAVLERGLRAQGRRTERIAAPEGAIWLSVSGGPEQVDLYLSQGETKTGSIEISLVHGGQHD